jgi:hypothetical protein
MTHKERMLKCIRGERTDRLPFTPRLDLWFKANKRAGTLPSKYKNASLDDIIADLDVGYHAVIPDFQDIVSPDDMIDRGIGIFNIRTIPYRTILENVTRKVRSEGPRKWVEYHTPVGSVTTCEIFTEEMKKAGITATHVEKYAIEKPDDYKVIGYIFENIRVEENYSGYLRFADYIGERGIAVGYVNGAASPMHLILRALRPYDQFCFDMMERPELVLETAQKFERYWEQMMSVCAESPAEVLFMGGNFDSSLTYPPFYEEYLMPWIKKFAGMLHAKNKYLLTHTDGENSGLLDLYLKSDFDIADSICPAPMTRLNFSEIRQVFQDKITIMGGIPSTILLSDCMSDNNFNTYLDHFFDNLGGYNKLILGISDTAPPNTDFNRILQVKKYIDSIQIM